MNAGLELSVDLVCRRAFLAEVVDLALETGVLVHDFAVPDKQLRFTIRECKVVKGPEQERVLFFGGGGGSSGGAVEEGFFVSISEII